MMSTLKKNRLAVLTLGIVIGLTGGLAAHRWMPAVPVQAVATHGGDQFAIATGPVDDRFEAFFFLDYLTGDLTASVLNTRGGGFNSVFKTNVLKDFGGAIGKNPKFLITTGMVDFPRGRGNTQSGRCVAYVAEMTTGQVAVYGLPWNSAAASSGNPQTGELVTLDMKPFRGNIVRDAAP